MCKLIKKKLLKRKIQKMREFYFIPYGNQPDEFYTAILKRNKIN